MAPGLAVPWTSSLHPCPPAPCCSCVPFPRREPWCLAPADEGAQLTPDPLCWAEPPLSACGTPEGCWRSEDTPQEEQPSRDWGHLYARYGRVTLLSSAATWVPARAQPQAWGLWERKPFMSASVERGTPGSLLGYCQAPCSQGSSSANHVLPISSRFKFALSLPTISTTSWVSYAGHMLFKMR